MLILKIRTWFSVTAARGHCVHLQSTQPNAHEGVLCWHSRLSETASGASPTSRSFRQIDLRCGCTTCLQLIRAPATVHRLHLGSSLLRTGQTSLAVSAHHPASSTAASTYYAVGDALLHPCDFLLPIDSMLHCCGRGQADHGHPSCELPIDGYCEGWSFHSSREADEAHCR